MESHLSALFIFEKMSVLFTQIAHEKFQSPHNLKQINEKRNLTGESQTKLMQ